MAKKRSKRKSKSKFVPKLTGRMKRLCDIYHSMRNPNKTKAYELAGYSCRGNTAHKEAVKTLQKPQCQAYLAKLREKATERAEKNADDIIRELEILAFSNIGDFVKFGKKGVVLTDSSKLTKEQLACISEVSESCSKKGKKYLRFRLHSKLDALEKLGRVHGIYSEDNKQKAENLAAFLKGL